jgi:hypothetical protein
MEVVGAFDAILFAGALLLTDALSPVWLKSGGGAGGGAGGGGGGGHWPAAADLATATVAFAAAGADDGDVPPPSRIPPFVEWVSDILDVCSDAARAARVLEVPVSARTLSAWYVLTRTIGAGETAAPPAVWDETVTRVARAVADAVAELAARPTRSTAPVGGGGGAAGGDGAGGGGGGAAGGGGSAGGGRRAEPPVAGGKRRRGRRE